jgi:hypothetical protein
MVFRILKNSSVEFFNSLLRYQKVVSGLSRATQLRKEKSGDLVSHFSKIASA